MRARFQVPTSTIGAISMSSCALTSMLFCAHLRCCAAAQPVRDLHRFRVHTLAETTTWLSKIALGRLHRPSVRDARRPTASRELSAGGPNQRVAGGMRDIFRYSTSYYGVYSSSILLGWMSCRKPRQNRFTWAREIHLPANSGHVRVSGSGTQLISHSGSHSVYSIVVWTRRRV